MKVCPKCGATYEGDYKFCKVCGTGLVDYSQPIENQAGSQSSEAHGAAAAAATTSSSKAPASTGGTGPKDAQKKNAGSAAAAVAGSFMRNVAEEFSNELSVAVDEKAVYLPGIVLTLDNISEFMFMVVRPKFTWWMKLLLACGILFWVMGTLGAALVAAWGSNSSGTAYISCGMFFFIIVAIAYFVRRALADKALIFAMNSGDKAKIISKDEKLLQQYYGILSSAVINHKPCTVTFPDAKLVVNTNDPNESVGFNS